MKSHLLPRLLVLLLSLASVAPAMADPGGDHATKVDGPNRGRILTALEPHAELFVTAERKVRLTFVDDAGRPVAIPAGFTATLITGVRSAPTTLQFAPESAGTIAALLTTTPLPEGQNLPAILRAQPEAGAETVTIRLQLNLARCGDCDRPEYACVCGH